MHHKKPRLKRSISVPSKTHGFDGAGHMDPKHKKHLLALSREGHSKDVQVAFIPESASKDELAEQLAESAVIAMTSGEDEGSAVFNADVEEERGGPFVETSDAVEFARGTDESNTKDATREPFPTT